ncbi:hypothetical protein MMC07_009247 [Pseudocyphellaria aurata]|nr:hypothetical protein [Pseudocyphellaria aurata]
MQLSNLMLPLALIANAAFATPIPAVLEKRTEIFYFPSYGGIGYGQPPDFSPAKYPFFCYYPEKDLKLYFPARDVKPRCGSVAIQNTDPNATVA